MKALKLPSSKKVRVVKANVEVEAKQPAVSEPDDFLALPKDIEGEILSYIPVRPKDGKQINQVNKRWSTLFKPDLLGDRILCGDLETVKTILQNAASQDAKQQKAVEAKEAPHALRDLLLKKKKVVDYSGRTIIGTALQLAWGAEDPEMIELIQQALLTFPDGKEIIKAQYAEQFPAGWQEKEKQEWAPIIQAMQDAFFAIEQAQNDDVHDENKKIIIQNPPLETALNHFRTLLTKKMQGEPITTGRHFNPALWLQAAETHDDFNAWIRRGAWSTRNDLAWCHIYGFIQRFLPARDAMATAQGVCYLAAESEDLKRSFKFRHEPAVSIYPLCSDSGDILGENYGVSDGGLSCKNHDGDNSIATIILIKNRKLADLRQSWATHPKTMHLCTPL